jgi:hypothetical protein
VTLRDLNYFPVFLFSFKKNMFRVCITISLILLPFVFGETPALCSLCKYGTCNNDGKCICENEVQGIFCDESFADVLGGAYIGYQGISFSFFLFDEIKVFALVVSSILFIGGISLVVLTGLWKVQVERAQTGAIGILTFGLLCMNFFCFFSLF